MTNKTNIDPTALDSTVSDALLRSTAHAFDSVFGAMHKPVNPETVLGNRPVSSLLAAGALNGATKPEPGLSTRDAEGALTKLVREFATDIREKGYSIDDLKFSPEWQEARALYFLYCNGFEDALYESRAILAAAVRADKSAWVGDVVLHAWYEYADDALVTRINEEVAESNALARRRRGEYTREEVDAAINEGMNAGVEP